VTCARVLFTCRPLAGHYEPLVPLAAAREAGHVVAFATGEPFDERARRAGFEAFRVGPSESFRGEWAPRFPGFERLVGDEQRRFFLTEIFANLELQPRAVELEAVVDEWAPQLVVHEVAELAAPLVCSARGIPYVDVSYGRLIPRF
jgi:UDP:flavonoid glycosyltransferase YjiC (YdhE family)